MPARRGRTAAVTTTQRPAVQAAPPVSAPRRRDLHVADLLLPLALGLWAVGVSQTNATSLGPYGLPASLPVVFYAGLALLVVSATTELARGQCSRWRMAAHSVGLVVILYGTAPLVYPEGRYSWLYKTIGVVQYVNANGHLDSTIDIYQNWPGFFALAAWFGKVAGVSSPLAYAKWAQLVFELAALPLLYLAYDALSLTARQRWLALLLYSASNWIGQDYFSPQGLGTLFSLGVMAMALRWFYLGNRGREIKPKRRPRAKQASAPGRPPAVAPITREEVYEAYRIIRSYQGPPGVDGVTIRDFEANLPRNLQAVWSRLRDQSFELAPIRAVPLNGRGRTFAVWTVSDWIAQTVMAQRLQAALDQTRQAALHARTPPANPNLTWAIELDLQEVFARCRHDLILRVVDASTSQEWMTEFVDRCLRVPARQPDGSLSYPRSGTPPGSPMGSVLADLFLYYTVDAWMSHEFPDAIVVRNLDEAVIYSASEDDAYWLRGAIAQRLEDVGLGLEEAQIPITRRRYSAPGAEPAGAARAERHTLAGTPAAAAVSPRPVDQLSPDFSRSRAWHAIAIRSTLMLVFFVLSFTHELSPYIVLVQLGALAATRLLRPRWLPVALAAIAIGYLLPRLSYVNSHYGLLSSIGSFFSNVAPPSSSGGPVAVPIPASQHMIERIEELLSLGMWALAMLGAWIRRRSGRTVLAMFFLAYSPVLILAIQAYGNEGILRVFLFSLPWTAALAASALAPMSSVLRTAAVGHMRRSPARNWVRRLPPGTFRAPLALAGVLMLFFPAFFGDDYFNAMPETEVSAMTSFLETARPGPVYLPSFNAPTADTARYNEFTWPAVFGGAGGQGAITQPTSASDAVLAQDSLQYTGGSGPAYIVIGPSMLPYSEAYGGASPQEFATLQSSLAHSRSWKLIVHQGNTMIYELPPRSPR